MSDDLGLEGLLADAMSASDDEAFSSEDEGLDPAMLAMLGGSEPEAARPIASLAARMAAAIGIDGSSASSRRINSTFCARFISIGPRNFCRTAVRGGASAVGRAPTSERTMNSPARSASRDRDEIAVCEFTKVKLVG